MALGDEIDPRQAFSLRIEPDSLGEEIDPQSAFRPQIGEEIDPLSVFKLPGPEESFGRIRSGMNAVAQRFGVALGSVAETASIGGQKFFEQARIAKALDEARQEKVKRQLGNLPGFVAQQTDIELTEQEREEALQPVRRFAYEDLEKDPIYQFGRSVAEFAEEAFPENPQFQGELFASVIPAAIGDIGGVIATRGVSAFTQVSADEFQVAMEAGASEDEAFQTFLLNLPVGALDIIPVGKLLKRLDTVSGGGVKKVLVEGFKGGLEEMVQEVVQTSTSNAIAGSVYDETRDIFDGLGDAAEGGFGAGAVLSGVAAAIGGRRARREKKKE